DNDMIVNEIRKGAIDRNTALSIINQGASVIGGAVGGFMVGGPIGAVGGAALGMISGGSNMGNNALSAIEEKRMIDIAYQQKMSQMLLSDVNITGSSLNFIKEGERDRIWFVKTEPVDIEKKY